MKATIAALGLVIIAGCGAPKGDLVPTASGAPAAPKFDNMVVTNDESVKTPMTTFASTTPKIFAMCSFENVKVGSKIKATWIADKAEGAAPNFKIDEANFDTTPLVNEATTSMTSPTKGWPVGDYHVEFSMNGKVVSTAKFSVSK
jgi:hypothetical protein